MTNPRTPSPMTIGALSAIVAAASFALGLVVFDDQTAAPPRPADEPVTAAPDPTSTTTTSAPPVVIAVGDLDTPAWVVVVGSGSSQASARATAASAARAGHAAGVLHSDDYPSLNAGLWVAYTGPYPDADAAGAAVASLTSDGFDGAYVRCVGTKKECERAAGGEDSGEDSDDD